MQYNKMVKESLCLGRSEPLLDNMFLVNAHAHIFPQKIAEKAALAIGAFYDAEMSFPGLSEKLLADGEKIGVDRYLVCSSATTGDQVAHINDFIAAECAKHPAFYGFGTLHPDFPEPEAELERVVSLGLHGIKLHPDFQRFPIDDPRMIPLYRKMTELGLPVLFHTGDRRYHYSNPILLRHVCDQVDGFRCIAAHFGGYSEWENVPEALAGVPGVYYDTSSTLFELPVSRAVELIEQLGAENFFFGTDFPMWDHEGELKRFRSMQLKPETEKAILGENFRRVFGI